MSYLISIKNNQEIKGTQLLGNRFVPEGIYISGNGNPDVTLEGFCRFYLSKVSSRGVALTVTETEYILELYIGASMTDYLLGAKIAMALAEINNAAILPDFDSELSLAEFGLKYDKEWAHASRLYEVESFLTDIVQKTGTVKLPGCVRGFYFGNYMLEKFKYDNPDENVFADRVIEAIRRVQFIELETEALEVPTLMDADLPGEGTKTVLVISPGYKLLVQKSDYIILRIPGTVLKVEYEKFIRYKHLSLERIDEEQYILQSIQNESYAEMMNYFSGITSKPDEREPEIPESTVKWWQFWRNK